MRNRRELNASLKGVTLGDADGDTGSALKWLKTSKKREKELVKKRQEELEQMDKVFEGREYTERKQHLISQMLVYANDPCIGDLEGLKVSHDFDELNEGDARILTLKDSRILDNEGKCKYFHILIILLMVEQRMSYRTLRWQRQKRIRKTRSSRLRNAITPAMMTKNLLRGTKA